MVGFAEQNDTHAARRRPDALNRDYVDCEPYTTLL